MATRVNLVTGAAGFIGSHLVEALLARGERVRALVRYNSSGRAGWLDEIPIDTRGGLEIAAGDIRDAGFVRNAAEGCDRIFHLAALIGIPYSYAAPASYVETNVAGALNILEAARCQRPERVILTSTSEVYGSAQYTPIDEEHPLSAQSPYAATKIASDQLALSYHRSFGTPISIARPFNTYGPRQSARAIVPTIVTQALVGGPIKLGNLRPTRDLIYVADTVAGFLAIADELACVGEVVNLATGTAISIGDLAARIQSVAATQCSIVESAERVRPKGSEVEALLGAAVKAGRLTGWTPAVDLNHGLALTIDWIRERRDQFHTGVYSV